MNYVEFYDATLKSLYLSFATAVILLLVLQVGVVMVYVFTIVVVAFTFIPLNPTIPDPRATEIRQ